MSGEIAGVNPMEGGDARVWRVYKDMGGNIAFQRYENFIRLVVQENLVDTGAGVQKFTLQRVELVKPMLQHERFTAANLEESEFLNSICTNDAVVSAFSALEHVVHRHRNPAHESYEALMSYHQELIPQRYAVMMTVFKEARRLANV